jgi:hypothetical protein
VACRAFSDLGAILRNDAVTSTEARAATSGRATSAIAASHHVKPKSAIGNAIATTPPSSRLQVPIGPICLRVDVINRGGRARCVVCADIGSRLPFATA